MSDMLRITGMVSGMDTDATVKKLIQLEQTKVDSAKQDKQILEWKKEQYREIATAMKAFQDTYFDLLKPDTNFRSKSSFNLYKATATLGGVSTSAVSATATSNSNKGSIVLKSISQLATKDSYKSDSKVVGGLKGSAAVNYTNINSEIALGNNTLTFTLDGTSKTITLDGGYASNDDLVSDLNTKLTQAFPSTTIEASHSAGVVSFDVKRAGVVEEGHTVTVGSAHSSLLGEMKFSSGQSNKVNLTQTVGEAFGLSGDVDLTINGVSNFDIKSTDTVEQMMNKINGSSAGVTLSYDSTTDKFKLQSNNEGTTNTISKIDTDGLLGAMKLNTHEAAKDAVFVIKTDSGDVSTTRNSNTFTLDGTQITLKETSTSEITINVESNASDMKDKIVKFVDEYNKLIEKINNKVAEKKYYDYKPLTDDQKKELESEDEKVWQDKAKSGLLRGDNTLESITGKLRVALYESVEGVSITLKDIGISTSANYKDKGKLTINEDELTKALEEKPDQVIALFTNESDKEYLDGDHSAERYKENGLSTRIYDILRDNIRTTQGKGYLITKAGNPESAIDTSSDLYKSLKQADERINDLLDLLRDKETTYYNQFARLESSLARLNNQSASILQQMGAS